MTLGAGNTVVLVNGAATTATIGFQNGLAGIGVPLLVALNSSGSNNPVVTVINSLTGQGLFPTADQTITVATATTGKSGGLVGLLPSANQVIGVGTTTIGAGLTGTAIAPLVLSPTAVGGQGGLTGAQHQHHLGGHHGHRRQPHRRPQHGQ